MKIPYNVINKPLLMIFQSSWPQSEPESLPAKCSDAGRKPGSCVTELQL